MEEEVKDPLWCQWTTWVAVLPRWNKTTCKINGRPNNSNQVLVPAWIKDQATETAIWEAEEVILVAVWTLSTKMIISAIWVLECPVTKWIWVVRTRCSMAKGKVDNVKCRTTWICNLNKVTGLIILLWEERPACPQEICLTLVDSSLIRACTQVSNSNRTSWAKDLTWDSTPNKTSKARDCSLVGKTWWWTSRIWWEDNNSGTTSNMGGLQIWKTISWTREL